MSGETTVRDDLVAAADAVVGEELPIDSSEAIVDEPTLVDDAPLADAEPEQAPEETPQTEPPIEPLQQWPYAFREQFNKLGEMEGGRDHQQGIIDQFKDFQRREMDHVRELDRYRGQMQQIDQMMQPFDQQFAMAGLDRISGVRQLLSWAQVLGQNPANGIAALAQSYGLDLAEVAKGQPYVDPVTRQHQQQTNAQINDLRAQLAQRAQGDRRQFEESVMASVAAFEHAANEDGSPKYPYVERVKDRAAQMIGPYLQAGQMPPLEEIYNQCVASDPAIQKEVLDNQVKAELERRKATAQRAQQASAQVKGDSQGSKPKANRTLRQETEAVADKLYAKAGLD